MDKTNTHFYDGKIVYKKIEFNVDMCQIVKLLQDVNKCTILTDTGRKCLSTIIDDLNTKRNFDASNNMSVEDILSDIVILINRHSDRDVIYSDYIELIALQFNEMISGMCSQGRTHRLYQILNLLY